MGLTFRKTLNAGLFRFSFSKSGVGVSFGFGGFRYGLGPKGNYISVNKGIFHFRKFLSSSSRSTVNGIQHVSSGGDNNTDILDTIEGCSNDLIEDFKAKSSCISIFPLALTLFAILFFALITKNAGTWLIGGITIPLLFLLNFLQKFDQARKTVVLFYDLPPELENNYEASLTKFNNLSSAQKVVKLYSENCVDDTRYSAGASRVFASENVFFSLSGLPHFECNVPTPTIIAKSAQYLFLPDRLVVFTKTGICCFMYKELNAKFRAISVVETGTVPSDAQIIGETWRFVNKDGSRDRRFKDNNPLAIVAYEEFNLVSPSGPIGCFHVSKMCSMSSFFSSWLGLVDKIATSNSTTDPKTKAKASLNYEAVAGSMIDLFALVLKADEGETQNEISIIKNHLVSIYSATPDFTKFIKNRLYQSISGTPDPVLPCKILNSTLSKAEKESFFAVCKKIAHLNNSITFGEKKILNYIAMSLELGSFDEEVGDDQSDDGPANLDWAYKILGVPSNTSIERIKEVYRFKVQQVHPDKIDFMDEEIKKFAQSKFVMLKKAYDAILRNQSSS